MSMSPQNPNSPHSLGGAIERLRSHWGWFVVYGALCLIFGVAALVLAAMSTLAVVFFVALMLILAGGVEIMIGVNSRDWPSFFLWLISGLFYLVFGAFALARPEVAAAVLTAVVGFGFLFAGLVRIWLGARLPAGPKAFICRRGYHAARRHDSRWLAGQYHGDPRNSLRGRHGFSWRELDSPGAEITPLKLQMYG
jgi:uncharacterized membrane protein HdeD (DUF308 family)